MNFEFLKDFNELSYIYKNCKDAEDLAISKPTQSMITSRKGAELLAKLIYLVAHNEQVEQMDFIEILQDETFKNYIQSVKVMNAFHYVRKNGNKAVHGEFNGTSEEAIDLLKNLHFISGEVACGMGLIKSYPSFNENIKNTSEVKAEIEDNNEQDNNIDDKVKAMFAEYIKKHDAQSEHERYFQEKYDELVSEFESDLYGCKVKVQPSDIEKKEVIEFKNGYINKETIEIIRKHFYDLAYLVITKMRDELPAYMRDRDVAFEGELTIYGENGYKTSNIFEFIHGIVYDLPFANGFRIYGKYFGPWCDLDDLDEISDWDYISKIENKEDFTYSSYRYFCNSGERNCCKFENGKWVDLKEELSPKIIYEDIQDYWLSSGVNLVVDFDINKHPEILKMLRQSVKKNLPKDDVKYCKEDWEDEPEVLINNALWYTDKIGNVQSFLDEINMILEPIKEECECDADGFWFITDPPFAVATWKWTEEGFKVVGVRL